MSKTRVVFKVPDSEDGWKRARNCARNLGSCVNDLEKFTDDHSEYDYHGSRTDCRAIVNDMLDKYGYNNTAYVIANRIKAADWDQRYSRSNHDWAENQKSSDVRFLKDIGDTISIHPCILDSITSELRKHEPSYKKK